MYQLSFISSPGTVFMICVNHDCINVKIWKTTTLLKYQTSIHTFFYFFFQTPTTKTKGLLHENAMLTGIESLLEGEQWGKKGESGGKDEESGVMSGKIKCSFQSGASKSKSDG